MKFGLVWHGDDGSCTELPAVWESYSEAMYTVNTLNAGFNSTGHYMLRMIEKGGVGGFKIS